MKQEIMPAVRLFFLLYITFKVVEYCLPAGLLLLYRVGGFGIEVFGNGGLVA